MTTEWVVGQQLPDLVRTFTLTDLVAYGSATWDWHRLHYDDDFAKASGMEGPIVDGQMFGALLAEQAIVGVDRSARIERLHFRNRRPVLVGQTITCAATVTAVDERGIDIEQTIESNGTLVVAPAGATLVWI